MVLPCVCVCVYVRIVSISRTAISRRENEAYTLTVTSWFSFSSSFPLSSFSSSFLFFHLSIYASSSFSFVTSHNPFLPSPLPDPCDYSPFHLLSHLLLLSFVQIYNIHNSRLTITWSVVQPNVRRPLYVHLPSPALRPGGRREVCRFSLACRGEEKKETRLRSLENSTGSSIASRTGVAPQSR